MQRGNDSLDDEHQLTGPPKYYAGLTIGQESISLIHFASSITITARKEVQLTEESAVDVEAVKWLQRTQVGNNVPKPLGGEREDGL